MPVITIRSAAELNSELVKAGGKLVVIDFTATWCGPCKMIAPEYEKLSDKYKGARFTKVDVDECTDISETYSVRSMPTFVFLKHSKEIDRFSGANATQLEEIISKNCTIEKFVGTGYTLSGNSNEGSDEPIHIQPQGAAGGGIGIGSWLGSVIGLGGAAAAAGGSNSNQAVSAETLKSWENQAKEIFQVDDKSPVCQVQLRLTDGSKLAVRLNTNDPVTRLREYISVARPSYADLPYQLLTTHPNKVIEDESQTLEQAKIANCVVVVQLIK